MDERPDLGTLIEIALYLLLLFAVAASVLGR